MVVFQCFHDEEVAVVTERYWILVRRKVAERRQASFDEG